MEVSSRLSSVSKQVETVEYNQNKKAVDNCCCEVLPRNIKCNWCAYQFFGRIRTKCQEHPRIIHLMDAVVCPRCRGSLQ